MATTKRKKVSRRRVATPLDRWGASPTSGVIGQHFLPLPVDRTLELRFDLGDDWDGSLDLGDVAGARVKVVVFVAEERADLVDRAEIRTRVLEAGAAYVQAPTVHVVRKVARRDERHAAEVPLEESILLFAEETRPRDAEGKVEFAVALAREADADEGGQR